MLQLNLLQSDYATHYDSNWMLKLCDIFHILLANYNPRMASIDIFSIVLKLGKEG